MASSENQTLQDLENSKQPPQSRIIRYDQYFDLRTFSETLRKTGKPPKKRSNKNPAIVVRRIIDHRGRHTRTDVDIKSEGLCQVLLELNQNVEGLKLTRSPPTANPKLFFHSYEGLKKKLDEERSAPCPDESLILDLHAAIQYTEEDEGGNMEDFVRLTSHQEITFDLLWALISPNSLVYHFHQFTEQDQVLLARSVDYNQRRDSTRYALIDFDVLSSDGVSFGYARDYLEIDEFEGSRKIQDLAVFPLKFHKDYNKIQAHAIERGKKIVTTERQMYEISGPAMMETMNKEHKIKYSKFSTYGRVMVDPVGFRLFEPNCTYNLPVHKRLDKNMLKEEQYIIARPIMLGFCFGVKKWGGFSMDRMKDIVWSDEAFTSLVLNPRQKTLIYSLIKQHTRRSEKFDDFIKGKGKGLIGLLTGRPGCGKTLTAEAAAEVTRRPLYVVSAGELGTSPEDVDKRLSKILELSKMWTAVLLIDEAEVFLQERSSTDIVRNALVSIFLRQLEYYQGILILTTNLAGQCDPALESRIHFCVHYPDLNFDSRKQIWKTFLSRAMDQQDDISREDMDKLATHEMNGRQIKNVVSSAQCIALEAESPLLVEHINAVLEVASDWHKARV
ncbi:AAA family ATPase [Pyrrhoderma noxium]|uniref:AAA family ATPase n=1 Tax=Pyrrhoderma noxium TaxID=2282107 RepID=A0A286USJ3_9AGAM|nr:AAA family ATPase [Pyrrhoderma noxium]